MGERSRFARIMQQELPVETREFKSYFAGGVFAYRLEMYYFRANAESIRALLESRAYKRHEFGMAGPLPVGGLTVPRGWPEPRDWDGLEVYRFRTEDGWFYYILTDGAKTQAFFEREILSGTILVLHAGAWASGDALLILMT